MMIYVQLVQPDVAEVEEVAEAEEAEVREEGEEEEIMAEAVEAE